MRHHANRHARHYFQTDHSADLVKQLENLNAKNSEGFFSVRDHTVLEQENRSTKTVIAIFLYGFLTMITLIGITNIFNTISTNVALRQREFAMLKKENIIDALKTETL